PRHFRCEPGARCFPLEWRCDGHPDCSDGGDEAGCATATATAADTSPHGLGVTPAGSAGPGKPSTDVQTRCCEWFSAYALSSLALLSILVAVGSVAVWGLSKAKHRPDICSLERASREQLIPEKSQ
ncbi:RSVR protein, partial [Todus mexicanus]|nr:RSVR protein [Todus mexicanus]